MPSFFAYDLSSVLDEDNGGSNLIGFGLPVVVSASRDYGTLIPECAWMIGTSSSTPDSSRREAGWEILAQGSSTFSCALGVSLGARHTAR